MSYQLIYTQPAQNDVLEIGLYISRKLHSPQAALDLLDRMDEKILSLEQMPSKYALISDERLAWQGIRKISVNNHLVFYYVDEHTQTVMIVRVLYGSRDWINLL